MSTLAGWLAYWTWASILWLMRRPSMKRAQVGWLQWMPTGMRDRLLESHQRQNRWARRHGRRLLKAAYLLLLLSMSFTLCYWLLLEMADRGMLNPLQDESS